MSIREYIKESEREEFELDVLCEQMNGAEIAKELGISRQAVSQTIKRGLVKMYDALMKENSTGPFETAVNLAIGLNVDDEEYKKFFKLFPPKIRTSIEDDAKNLIRQK